MNVISGLYKGRKLKGFDIDGTRPTQDRVKESMFASIQNNLRDAMVLDLFAGTGSLGIEALSNYSEFCYFIDSNNICCNTIKDNLNNIGITNAKVLNMDYKKALTYFKDNLIKFDIILIDPPYKDLIIKEILEFICSNSLLNDNGIVVIEAEHLNFKDEYDKLTLIKEKKYGYKHVLIYKDSNK